MRILSISDRECGESLLKKISGTNDILLAKNSELKKSIHDWQQKYCGLLEKHYAQQIELSEVVQKSNAIETELIKVKQSAFCSDLINITNVSMNASTSNERGHESFQKQNISERDMTFSKQNDIVSGSIQFTADVRDCFFSVLFTLSVCLDYA